MGKRGKKVSPEGAKIARYCAAFGVSEKTARTHRAKCVQQWEDFEREPVTVREAQGLSDDALRHYQALVVEYDKALGHHSGPETLGKYERALSSAQERYKAALLADNEAKVRAGLLLPYEDVIKLKDFIIPLVELFRGLRDGIGGRIKEESARQQFFEAYEPAMDAWNDEIDRLNRKIAEALPCF